MRGCPHFSFWISIARDVIYLSHIVIIWEKYFPLVGTVLNAVSWRNRMAERQGQQNACVWQTWQGWLLACFVVIFTKYQCFLVFNKRIQSRTDHKAELSPTPLETKTERNSCRWLSTTPRCFEGFYRCHVYVVQSKFLCSTISLADFNVSYLLWFSGLPTGHQTVLVMCWGRPADAQNVRFIFVQRISWCPELINVTCRTLYATNNLENHCPTFMENKCSHSL